MKITEAGNGGYWPGDPDEIPEYNYEFTELDDMPDGWRDAFGIQMCEEIREALLAAGGEKALREYRITQIKEKYGSLRWYDMGSTKEILDIISKYAEMSKRICVRCGKPATQVSCGWISPWCDECAGLINDRMISVEEWIKPADEYDNDESE